MVGRELWTRFGTRGAAHVAATGRGRHLCLAQPQGIRRKIMWSRNALTDRLGLDCPIILAPMAGATTPELAAAVSNAGGLGSLGLATSPTDAAESRLPHFARCLTAASTSISSATRIRVTSAARARQCVRVC